MTDGDDRIGTPRDPPTVGVEKTQPDMTGVDSGDRRRSAELHETAKQTHPAVSARSNNKDKDKDKVDSTNALEIALDGATDTEEAGDPSHQAAGNVAEVADENEGLPVNNMWLVMPALGLVAFISALDQTIIATALPTIAAELGATPSEYSWVGTSYLLAQTIMTPINGRLTDIIGRKPALYASIVTLLVFSALCGAAKSIQWLIVARALAGLGGGSIVGMTTIVISDIVPLHRVGEYQGNLGVAYGFASVLGPPSSPPNAALADLPPDINIPCCFISLILLAVSLKLNPTPHTSWAEVRRTFDFPGLTLLIAGAALTIVGFATAADSGFGTPHAYAFIVAGFAVLALTVLHCATTRRNAIVPRRLLRTRTPLFFVLGSFLQSLMFVAAGFLLPQFFQGVRGSSALSAGVQLLPFACGCAVFGVLAGQATARVRVRGEPVVRPLVWAGYALAGVAYLLWYACFTSTVSIATQEGLLLLASAGVGTSVMPPILLIQAAMPLADMAASTATWVLMRSLGATIGLAIFTAILNTGLRTRFERIPGYGVEFTVPHGTTGYRGLHELPEGETKRRVLAAFADSVRICFVVGAGFLFAALALTLCTKHYPLSRKAPAGSSSGSSEASSDGEVPIPAVDSEKQTVKSPV